MGGRVSGCSVPRAFRPPTCKRPNLTLTLTPLQVGRLVEYIGRVVYAGEDNSLRVVVKAHRLANPNPNPNPSPNPSPSPNPNPNPNPNP